MLVLSRRNLLVVIGNVLGLFVMNLSGLNMYIWLVSFSVTFLLLLMNNFGLCFVVLFSLDFSVGGLVVNFRSMLVLGLDWMVNFHWTFLLVVGDLSLSLFVVSFGRRCFLVNLICYCMIVNLSYWLCFFSGSMSSFFVVNFINVLWSLFVNLGLFSMMDLLNMNLSLFGNMDWFFMFNLRFRYLSVNLGLLFMMDHLNVAWSLDVNWGFLLVMDLLKVFWSLNVSVGRLLVMDLLNVAWSLDVNWGFLLVMDLLKVFWSLNVSIGRLLVMDLLNLAWSLDVNGGFLLVLDLLKMASDMLMYLIIYNVDVALWMFVLLVLMRVMLIFL
jgi:hypothetical protein